ncbi:CHRD domain-containing protein [Dyadobacter bucti]|uniref:CHRD domain-containing protein n=1 Tax=Dyadobacter bucti TaxID=2572203 RepID=UPI0011082C9F|nr:CHRD domain-containing protein [Dyadobacter bucti]
MKKPMKRFLLLITGVVMLGLVSSCKEEGPHKDDIVRFSAVINSTPTVPKATSSAQGTGVFEYNKTTRDLKYNITFQNLTPTSVTINNPSPAWEAGPILYTLAENPTGQVQGTIKLKTAMEEAVLIAGTLYVNMPTAQNIYGEIRGQIVADKID